MADPTINQLKLSQPIQWLLLGWQDFLKTPWVGMAHGLIIVGFGAALLFIGRDHFWFLAGAFSGFLLVAPILAVGLYAGSRAIEANKPADFKLVISTWLSWQKQHHHDWRLVKFGLLLGLSGTGWVLCSAALITLLSQEAIVTPLDFLNHVILAEDPFLFLAWMILGILLAAPVFASTVITVPLLLDSNIRILNAVLASWQVIMVNPVSMGIWAAVLATCTLVGIFTVVGALIIIPVLGHASWHLYRDALHLAAEDRR